MALLKTKTPDEIFEDYLNDKCPVCGEYMNCDNYQEHRTRGSKTISLEFECKHCHSCYTIGFNRRIYPIQSEITIDNYNK